jgi:hypothetical protein
VLRARIWTACLQSGSLKPLETCVGDELSAAIYDIDADYPRGDSGEELIATCEEFVKIAQEWVWDIRDDEAHSPSSERPRLGLWIKSLDLVGARRRPYVHERLARTHETDRAQHEVTVGAPATFSAGGIPGNPGRL